MGYITNSAFTQRERLYLEFLLQHEFPERSAVAQQLNAMQPKDISRDITPYYWMIQFRPGGANPGQGPMRPYIDVEVLHGTGAAPTEFTLYERNGIVFELEIYNADSSAMDLSRIMNGEICVHCPTSTEN